MTSVSFGYSIRRFLLAGAWAFSAALVGTAVWSILNAVVAFAQDPSFSGAVIGMWGGMIFGGAVAVAGILPYWALFTLWGALVARQPRLESTATRIRLAALGLAAPLSLVVFFSFLSPVGSLGPFWRDALLAGPMALLSSWCGIVLPRTVVPRLRPLCWVAA